MSLVLLLLALVPGILFLFYILYMDRNEPEPLLYILFILVMGALSCLPAAFIESVLLNIPVFNSGGMIGAALQSFVVIAPVEELCKLAVVLIFVWRNKNFNETNDGIVYAGTTALGFAMFENVFYVFENGISVGILRSVTAIPLHLFSGVLMGYFVGLAKFSDKPNKIRIILRGFLIAVFFHGIYDTFALSGTWIAIMIILVIIVLSVAGIRMVNKGRKLSLSESNRLSVPYETPVISDSNESDVVSSVIYNSSNRVGASSDIHENAVAMINKVKPESHSFNKIKAVVARVIFVVVAFFWLILIFAYFDKDNSLIPLTVSAETLKDDIADSIEDNNELMFLLSLYEIPVQETLTKSDIAVIQKSGEIAKDEIARVLSYYINNPKSDTNGLRIIDNIGPDIRLQIAVILIKSGITEDVQCTLNEDLSEETVSRALIIIKKSGYFLSISDMIVGGLVITLLPLLIGLLLEISYHRYKKR